MLNDQSLVTMVVSAAQSLTMGGVSGPGVEPSCLGKAGVDDETSAEIGVDTADASLVASTEVGA
jgi:hypothetical protein